MKDVLIHVAKIVGIAVAAFLFIGAGVLSACFWLKTAVDIFG